MNAATLHNTDYHQSKTLCILSKFPFMKMYYVVTLFQPDNLPNTKCRNHILWLLTESCPTYEHIGLYSSTVTCLICSSLLVYTKHSGFDNCE